MADLAVITGASSGLGVKFLEAVIHRYPELDEYWIIARRNEPKRPGKPGAEN